MAIDANHKVDGVRPTLVTTGNDAPQTSVDGTQVIFKVSEDVGSVNIGNIGLVHTATNTQMSASATASFSGSTVTVTLASFFTIQYGQIIHLNLSFGAVRDTAGNAIALTSGHAIANKVPQPPAMISTVEITSDPGMDSNYATGEDIEVTATFDQAVAVTGTPQILSSGWEVASRAPTAWRSTQAARGRRRWCFPTRWWPRTNPTPNGIAAGRTLDW